MQGAGCQVGVRGMCAGCSAECVYGGRVQGQESPSCGPVASTHVPLAGKLSRSAAGRPTLAQGPASSPWGTARDGSGLGSSGSRFP